jgi:hypothetical protein
MLTFRRRRIEFAGFLLESLQKNPNNPVNPVQRYFIKIESIPLYKTGSYIFKNDIDELAQSWTFNEYQFFIGI